jgi:hypothetical protein
MRSARGGNPGGGVETGIFELRIADFVGQARCAFVVTNAQRALYE